MDNYVAVVFNSEQAAAEGLHELWRLDDQGDVTMHGAAVIHRDGRGHIEVATKETDPGLRTAIGVAVGALLGALAGPIGAAAGASVAAGTAVGIGAATGGLVGLTADAVKSDEHDQAAYEAGFRILPGQYAVIAEISEDWTTPVDTEMERLGGTVYRRAKDTVRSDAFNSEYYPNTFVPYDYEPQFR